MKRFNELVKEAGENGLSYMEIGSGADALDNAFDKYQDLLEKHGEKNVNIAINIVYFQVLESLRKEIFIIDKMKFDSKDNLSMDPVEFIDKACSKNRYIPRGVMAHGLFYDENLDQKAFLDCVNDIYPKAVMMMAKELVEANITNVNKHRNKMDCLISKDMEVVLVASRLLSIPIGCNLIEDRMKTIEKVKEKNINEGPSEGRVEFINRIEGEIKNNKDFCFDNGRSVELEKILSTLVRSTDYSITHDTADIFFRVAKMEGLSDKMRVLRPMYEGKVLQENNRKEMLI